LFLGGLFQSIVVLLHLLPQEKKQRKLFAYTSVGAFIIFIVIIIIIITLL
jgi:hypothetical protein